MTYPRSHLVDPHGGLYHVSSRCVRRAFLCGQDEETGYNYDHRRQWIENRLLMLSEVFAIDLYSFAVMSNHYHAVVNVDPSQATSWSDEDVANKWMRLYPRNRKHPKAKELAQAYKESLLGNPARLVVLKERLCSLSWFMKCVNEPLAVWANQEDGCKGRFWQGRFDSQRLLDESGLLAAMVYVDLNPIRAGIANDVADSKHTSVHRRIQRDHEEAVMVTLNAPYSPLPINYQLKDYVALARWTALAQQGSRPITSVAQHSLARPPPKFWFEHYLPTPGQWQRAIGSIEALDEYAKEMGLCWIRTRSAHLRAI